MGWTLGQVRDLEVGEFDELVAWIKDKANRNTDSMDADAVADAMTAARDKKEATSGE